MRLFTDSRRKQKRCTGDPTSLLDQWVYRRDPVASASVARYRSTAKRPPVSAQSVYAFDLLLARRDAAIAVKFALLLPVLIGMLGLVIDSGLMMASHRQTQSAADAAALAYAMDRMRGRSASQASATATTFVTVHNDLVDSTPLTIHEPPQTGPYAGRADFVEVSVTTPIRTNFIQVLGIGANQLVRARAVAGFEAVAAGEGVMVLDPGATPGLSVSGQSTLRVRGSIVVNSAQGGVDENGIAVDGPSPTPAASAGQPNDSSKGIYAERIDVVGGVDRPAQFKPINPGDPSPLRTRQLGETDPLRSFPVPTVALGVDKTFRGDVQIGGGNSQGVQPGGYVSGVNSIAKQGDVIANGLHIAAADDAILHPGVYSSIAIQGGTTYFIPGIYVISANKKNQSVFSISGVSPLVIAEGVMIYNTGHNYNPDNGNPDSNDGETPPPGNSDLEDGAMLGSFSLNRGMKFSPLDTTKYDYASLYNGAKHVSERLNGMTYYQRRRSKQGLSISGNSSDADISGTWYAKWAPLSISGNGSYDAQFIVGSISLSGNGTIVLQGAGKNRGKANQVFLVE
jgi:hypothetical protein